MQNMFEVSYFSGSKEMIPSGWNVVDEDKTFTPLSSRNPQVPQYLDEDSGNGYDLANGRAGSESSSSDDPYKENDQSTATRMVEESSDEDEDEDELAPSAPQVSHPFLLRIEVSFPLWSSCFAVKPCLANLSPDLLTKD